ncbi:MAG: glycosyltransferase family 39 protein [Leptolyngbyaceae cyanobacterium MO_188.B28]|nr:glycosyltransferase family 39 protein [Leptolyngbyaceae cyanobacterium MO_188.B28]
MGKSSLSLKNSFNFAISFILILGISFRCLNLDRKVYWHDEVFTSIRVVGYTGAEIEPRVFNGEPITAAELQQFQQLTPEKNFGDTLHALAKHAEHPPLYYLLARGWVQAFGSSTVAFRSLSVVFSLLAFPCLYWLCQALFGAPGVPVVSLLLLAVSPFHVLYAQEAREYSLWTVTILLSSVTLLRATERGGWRHWGAYGLSLALGMYTSLLTVLAAIAHGLFVLITTRRRQWLAYGLTLLATLGLFSPWITVMLIQFSNLKHVTDWTTHTRSLEFLIKIWGLHISSVFIDPGFELNHPFTYMAPTVVLIMAVIGAYRLSQTQSSRVVCFVLTLTLIPALGLILPDLLMGGQRSVSTRYFLPTLIGIQLIAAYGLVSLLTSDDLAQRRWGKGGLVSVLIAGILSCSLSAQAHTWWNKGISYHNFNIAQVINRASNPVVVGFRSANSLGNAISLSYLLKPATPFQMTQLPNIPDISDSFSDVFLIQVSGDLIQGLEQTYGGRVEGVKDPNAYGLWKLTSVD